MFPMKYSRFMKKCQKHQNEYFVQTNSNEREVAFTNTIFFKNRVVNKEIMSIKTEVLNQVVTI